MEQHQQTLAYLHRVKDQLKIEEKLLIKGMDVFQFLQQDVAINYDLIFLDPPFSQSLLSQCGQLLVEKHWLSENAKIYCEMECHLLEPNLPKHWQKLREQHIGNVKGLLLQNKQQVATFPVT